MTTAVLLATYNGARFLGEQLSSLMTQTVSDFVVYVHDDGSTDDTRSVIEDFAARFPGRIVSIEGAPCGGAKENFWFLLSRVEADVYFFCDQDDVWLPQKVAGERKALLRLIEESTKIEKPEGVPETPGSGGSTSDGALPCLVFSDMKVCDAQLSVTCDSFWTYIGRDASDLRLPRVLIDNPAAGTSMCFNRALRDVAVGTEFDLSGVEMHDGFLLAMALLLGKVRRIKKPLVLYRQHGANEMGAAKAETRRQRVVRNLAELCSGRLAEKKRAFVSLSRAAAGELARIEGADERTRWMLRRYAGLGEMSKLRRVAFMWKYGFNRVRHTWWMYFWV